MPLLGHLRLFGSFWLSSAFEVRGTLIEHSPPVTIVVLFFKSVVSMSMLFFPVEA